MKSNLLLLSILAVTAIGIVNSQDAIAQHQAPPQSARYDFAPHFWLKERPTVPGEDDRSRAVRQGAMPLSPVFLGLDPGMLNPLPQPVLPVPEKLIPLQQVTNKFSDPLPAIKSDFGKPIQLIQTGEPVKMATRPPGANSPIPQMAAIKVVSPVRAARSSAPRHSGHSTAVHAKLQIPSPVRPESATVQIASYPGGYQPAADLPAQSGFSMETSSDVRGYIVRH